MTTRTPRIDLRPLGLAIAFAAALTTSATAHHGWSWAEAEPVERTGTIQSIEISPPHPVLEVDFDGELWTVELGNPGATERAGFVEGVAAPGDEITVLGNQSTDPDEPRMKAVQITIGEDVYDIYPDRIPAQ